MSDHDMPEWLQKLIVILLALGFLAAGWGAVVASGQNADWNNYYYYPEAWSRRQ